MIMTVNEYKADLYQRGFTIIEKDVSGHLQIMTEKMDTDGLIFNYKFVCDYGIMTSDEGYIVQLKDMSFKTDNLINHRHAQDINTCQHNPVMIGVKKACQRCMGKFGERMVLDINDN